MNTFLFKVLIMVCIFVECSTFGLIPLVVKKLSSTWRNRILGLANAFAGGVFLSGGFIHLLGETQVRALFVLQVCALLLVQ